jgi:SseB protein N-terminal domain
VPGLLSPDERFRDDDGAAQPLLAAALAAYAAGQESEHAVLTALARARLLVPVVAAVTASAQTPAPGGRVLRREKASEMAVPTLTGRDGRRAIIAFTSADTLRAWRAEARPVPVGADLVCQAAAAESAHAVVVDVAGPVPLAIEGARLAALAAGRPVPWPADDPDVRSAVADVVAGDSCLAAAELAPGTRGTDLTVRVFLARGPGAAADPASGHEAAARRAASAIMAALAGRFRRGIEIAVVPWPPGRPAAPPDTGT